MDSVLGENRISRVPKNVALEDANLTGLGCLGDASPSKVIVQLVFWCVCVCVENTQFFKVQKVDFFAPFHSISFVPDLATSRPKAPSRPSPRNTGCAAARLRGCAAALAARRQSYFDQNIEQVNNFQIFISVSVSLSFPHC